MGNMIVDNIIASYDKELIVNNVSFTLETGKFTALLGLNGTGKTTLLKIISGLLKSKSGQCLIDHVDINKISDKKRARHVSLMPQRHSVVYDTKVIDVVLMGITPYLKAFDSPTKDHHNLAYNALEKVGMERYAYGLV